MWEANSPCAVEQTVPSCQFHLSSFSSLQCDPNLQVFSVFIDNLDTRLPRIALFSTRTIKAGEELTFDYQMKGMVFKNNFIGIGFSMTMKASQTNVEGKRNRAGGGHTK